MVVRIAQEQGVDPDLALRVAKQESGFNPAAVSPAGARGVMQVMPDTAKGLGVSNPLDLHDPETGITAGVKYLAQLSNQFGGDDAKTRAAYFAGPDTVAKGGLAALGPKGQDYVAKTAPASQPAPNRGNQISGELAQNQQQPQQPQYDLQPVDFDPFAPQPSFVGNIVNAAKSGAVQSLKDLASAGDALVKGQGDSDESTQDFAKPLEWEDLKHPLDAVLPKAVYQLAHGAPTLIGGVAGAVAGEAMAPEAGAAGPVVGGALGAAAMQTAQSLGPTYAAEIKATPNDPDGAFDRAVKKSGTDGAFTAAGWLAFSFAPFEGAVKNLLLQAFAVQPGVAAAQQATSNVIEGKPIGEGVAQTIPGAVVGTALPAAGMHLAGAAIGKATPEEPPAPEPATPETPSAPPALGFQAGPPMVTFPDGTTMTQAEYQQRQADGMTGSGTPPPAPEPLLSPIDQARADAQILKSGADIPGADDTRQRNATLVSVYGENAAVRHVIEGGDQFSAIGDAMLMAAPTVERVRGTLQNPSRDITSDILQAVDEIGQIKAQGKSVGQVLAEGVPHDISFEGQQLMQFLDENSGNPQRLASFIENYLQEVENATGVPSEVRGRAFDIIQERQAAAQTAADQAKDDAFAKAEKDAQRAQKTQAFKAVQQNRGDMVATELAKAKGAGSGLNPDHQTAMELAFANAKTLKGKNEKPSAPGNESVQGGSSAGPANGLVEPAKRAGSAPSVVSEPDAAGNGGNPRPVYSDIDQEGVEPPVEAAAGPVNRGKAIAAERKTAQAPTAVVQEAGPKASATAATRTDNIPEAERFQGQYGQGMGERNARDAQKRLAVQRPDLAWDVAPSTKTADRFDVVGRKKTVDELAHEAATSPKNELPQPSEAQLEAGNYKKGPVKINGMDISVENPAGSKRRPEWPELNAHYGYVKDVEARAPDKEHVDVFVKPGTKEDHKGPVFVVDQNHSDGRFDEPKALLGYRSQKEARTAYLKNYTPGWEKNVRGITEMTSDEFKAKLNDPAGFLKPQRDVLNPRDIPADLKIPVPVNVETTGETHTLQPNARTAFKEMSRKVNRLQSLLDCLRS